MASPLGWSLHRGSLVCFFAWVAEDWNRSGQQDSAPGKLRGKGTAELCRTSVLALRSRLLQPTIP